jgi:DNA mismatch endonuclease (patch repair protein)
MTDSIGKERRSENMRRIRSKGTAPEIAIRKLLSAMGVRYRLHARELPGKPDIVRRPQRQAIFVHGCFWHQHSAKKCLDGRPPKSNAAYWRPKLARNVERGRAHIRGLKRSGWSVLVIWDCQLSDAKRVQARLEKFLAGSASY